MQTIALVFLMINSLIAFFDGVLIHLFDKNLHFFHETMKEHKLHTARSFLFTIILIFLFYFKTSGTWLYFCIFLVIFDKVLEIWDIWEEKNSREGLEGLSNIESLLHALAISTRSLAYGFWFSQFSIEDLSIASSDIIFRNLDFVNVQVFQLIGSSIFVTSFHLYLMYRPVKLKLKYNFKHSCCS